MEVAALFKTNHFIKYIKILGNNNQGYCHIDPQQEKVPTQVRARRPGSEGGVGKGMGSSRTKM